MSTATARQFQRNAKMADTLAPGESLTVTHHGQPKFVVTKKAPPRMTEEMVRERAVGNPSGKKVDYNAWLQKNRI